MAKSSHVVITVVSVKCFMACGESVTVKLLRWAGVVGVSFRVV